MTKLGRNQRCWCGSQLKYKKCHYDADRESTNPESVNGLTHIRVLVPYENIYPGEATLTVIDDRIRGIDSAAVTRAFAAANYYLWATVEGEKQLPFETKEQEIAKDVFDTGALAAIARFKSRNPGTILFPRQQLLGLMKHKILSLETDERSFVVTDVERLGPALLAISSLMQADTNERLKASTATKATRDTLIAGMFRDQRFNEQRSFPPSLGRYWCLLMHTFPQAGTMFRDYCGGELKTFLYLALGIRIYLTSQKDLFHHSENFNIGPPFFSNMVGTFPAEAKAFFRPLANTLAAFKAEFGTTSGFFYYDFIPFWRKPLLELAPDIYCVLDQDFLQDKMTAGVRWMIHDAMLAAVNRGDIKDTVRKEFMRQWNVALERYVGDLLGDVTTRVKGHTITDLTGQHGRADFVLENDRIRVFIEVTGERILFKKILSAEPQELLTDIERILFDSPGNRGKMTQLADEQGKTTDGKTEYSIIVSEESFPETILWYEDITRAYQERHSKAAPPRFMVLTIEDFENMLALVIEGHDLGKIMDNLHRGIQAGVPFRNTLIAFGPAKHPFVQQYYNELWEGTARAMFDKGLLKKPPAG